MCKYCVNGTLESKGHKRCRNLNYDLELFFKEHRKGSCKKHAVLKWHVARIWQDGRRLHVRYWVRGSRCSFDSLYSRLHQIESFFDQLKHVLRQKSFFVRLSYFYQMIQRNYLFKLGVKNVSLDSGQVSVWFSLLQNQTSHTCTCFPKCLKC